MSDDEDPFEQFEDVSDRDGNPFERLGNVDEDSDSDTDDEGSTTDDDNEWGGDPLGDSDATEDASASETTDKPEYDAHDTTPADHADELPDGVADWEDKSGDEDEDGDGVVEMDEPEIDTGSDDPFGDVGERPGDPFEDDVFEEMDVDELDPDEVWASIADAEERGSVGQQAERIYAEVSKHRFCEQCEFFSKPPDVACSHEGTEILEFLDQETVRLVDCPVVAERKELEKHD